VTYVSAEDVPSFPQEVGTGAKGSALGSLASRKGSAGWTEEVRQLISAMVVKPKLSLSYDDFVSFDQYWRSVVRGDSALASKMADARGKH